ncbi:hypothetical protein [Frankia sp. QA3]|uniref:hypothetical protein n=1 Tax=Frankia sp. QA3 TaxID=710111 RepID=UPI000269CEF9|nr:hypothetical protein [Frankia sp. QA3]EIV96283.1 hypothetical protein FraQA3DRAFT_6160 [Frankia sp. QA3]
MLSTPGGRIAVPPTSTSDELTFRRVLEYYGTSYAGLAARGVGVLHANYTDIAAAFARGEVSYLFGATAAPAAVIAEIGGIVAAGDRADGGAGSAAPGESRSGDETGGRDGARDGAARAILLPLPDDLIAHLGRRWSYLEGVIPADYYPGMQRHHLAHLMLTDRARHRHRPPRTQRRPIPPPACDRHVMTV